MTQNKKKGRLTPSPGRYRVPAFPSEVRIACGERPPAGVAAGFLRFVLAFVPRYVGLDSSGLRRPDPPRCCTDLQRLTGRCSRLLGFLAPPTSFSPCGVDPGVFQRSDYRLVVPARLSRHSWPCAHPRGPRSLPRPRSRTRLRRTDPSSRPSFRGVLPPLRRSQRAESTSRLSLPHRPKPLFRRSPRRGLPHPLRSAFVVFHDLDGLLLCAPCDLFQPLTPLGFGLPVPCSVSFHIGPKTDPSGRRG